MVPFDDKSPFVTSGIRVGTAAITTRGLVEEDMDYSCVDRWVLVSPSDEAVIEAVANEVNDMMMSESLHVFKF
jgi:glycine hydroxymethyltransferase